MQGFTGFTVLLCLFRLAASLITILNVEEKNSIHYAIDILNKPVVKGQKAFENDVMTIVNKFGQEYLCSLPHVPQSIDLHSKRADNILDQLVDISVLLKPMETAPCLIKTVDWWTYEFCYGSVIKQYHLEDNKASGVIIILGKYESEYNWRNSSETKNRLQRFHSQFYVNGTKCDLTAEPRRTEVRFHCEDGMGDYMQRVDEPESCRYIVTIATTRVCHHPYLHLQAVSTPHSITCAPALTPAQHLRYLFLHHNDNSDEDEDMTPSTQNPSITEEGEGTNKGPDSATTGPVAEQSGSRELLSNMEAGELLHRLDVSQTHPVNTADHQPGDPYLNEEDELEADIDDDDDDDDDEDELVRTGEGGRQGSKSTRRDHFSRIHKQLRHLGNMFANQEATPGKEGEEAEVAEKEAAGEGLDKFGELEKVMERIKEGHMKELDMEVKHWTKKLLNKEATPGKEGGEAEAAEKEATGQGLDKFGELEKVMERIKEGHMKELDEEVKHWTKKLLNKAKQEMETLEEFLDTQLEEMGVGPGGKGKDPIEGTSSPSSPLLKDTQDSEGSSKDTKKDSEKDGTQQLRVMKGSKGEDETQKTKLDQAIKDRLQKLGFEKIGRKFEVKIGISSSLEDDDTNSPLLSQEETYVFQNMKIKFVSANAEELQERENHRKLEKNYAFQWDDEQLAQEEEEEGE